MGIKIDRNKIWRCAKCGKDFTDYFVEHNDIDYCGCGGEMYSLCQAEGCDKNSTCFHPWPAARLCRTHYDQVVKEQEKTNERT